MHPLRARVRRPDDRSLVARFDPAKLAIPFSALRWRTLSSTSGCRIVDGAACFERCRAAGPC